jgi:hypothetical protein
LQVRSHQLVTDISLLTGFAAAFYGFALALRRPAAGGFWLGTGVGIGFMSKGLLAPGTLGIYGAAAAAVSSVAQSRLCGLLGVAALACAPWLLVWPARALPEIAEPCSAIGYGTTTLAGSSAATTSVRPRAPRITSASCRGIPLPALPLAAWVLWRARLSGMLAAPYALPITGFW